MSSRFCGYASFTAGVYAQGSQWSGTRRGRGTRFVSAIASGHPSARWSPPAVRRVLLNHSVKRPSGALTALTDRAVLLRAGTIRRSRASGRAPGCGAVVGIACGTHSRAELEQCGPNAVIERLSNLIPLVEAR